MDLSSHQDVRAAVSAALVVRLRALRLSIASAPAASHDQRRKHQSGGVRHAVYAPGRLLCRLQRSMWAGARADDFVLVGSVSRPDGVLLQLRACLEQPVRLAVGLCGDSSESLRSPEGMLHCR